MLRQFAGSNIGFKDPKPQTLGWVLGLHNNPFIEHGLDLRSDASRG
jgi:hypothetical protein